MDICQTLKIAKENLIVTSSETRYGKDKIVDKIYQLMSNFNQGGEQDEDICN